MVKPAYFSARESFMPISKTPGLTPSYDPPPDPPPPYTSVAGSNGGHAPPQGTHLYAPPSDPPPQGLAVQGAHGTQHANAVQYAPPVGPSPGGGPSYSQHAGIYQRLCECAQNASHLAQLCQPYSLPPFPNFGQSHVPASYSAYSQAYGSPYGHLHAGFGMGSPLCAAGALGHALSHTAHEVGHFMHAANHVAYTANNFINAGVMAGSALKALRHQFRPMAFATIGGMVGGPVGAFLGMQLSTLRW
ncbi:hypothetical protein EGT07_17260 [Herbaspirillum sp. HC18]|nr:hypothetical protein EGT07_17260 [Herbaspirillum sp. HC18]